MCGIVAAAARRNVVPLLIEGLRRLEYRGYDSCGIATVGDDGLRRARSTQRVAELARQAKELNAPTGIAHTRWATHGAPEVCNAHPHFSRGLIGLVHNGIIENYESIRERLKNLGYDFTPLPLHQRVAEHPGDHRASGPARQPHRLGQGAPYDGGRQARRRKGIRRRRVARPRIPASTSAACSTP